MIECNLGQNREEFSVFEKLDYRYDAYRIIVPNFVATISDIKKIDPKNMERKFPRYDDLQYIKRPVYMTRVPATPA